MKKILLLDDNMEVVILYRTLVGRLGHYVKTSSDPEEALVLASSEAFDLIITDLKMPKMSGVEFIEQLRAKGVLAKIVVITGYPTLQDTTKFAKLGVFKWLLKPVLIRTLEETIAAALGDGTVPLAQQASG